MDTPKQNPLITLPGAVIIAAAIIGIAFIWIQKPIPSQHAAQNTSPFPAAVSNIAPITGADHILGNPAASIKLVEYSDPSCPYCKMFNPTMEQIAAEYGPTGKVAWVYRHFPLYKPDQDGHALHPNAGAQAEAMECIAALGGETAFWAYEKQWYSVFPIDGADMSAADDAQEIATVAKSVGVDPVSFNECLASHRFADKIDQAYTAGINAGVTGTPYTVIITPSGTQIVRSGADSYSTLKSIIDTLLSGDQPSK